MPAINLVGRTFGRLKVLERAGSARSGKALWRCHCACGKVVVRLGTYLLCGDTRSCGCLHRDLAAAKGRLKKIDLTGQTFGRLTVRREDGQQRGSRGECRWLCDCACGGTTTTTGSVLCRGGCLSCGCLRLELMRARAAAVGSAQRIKACRTCGAIYTATGPQKDCSEKCRLRHHAADEMRRREELATIRAISELTATGEKLQRRMQ